MTGCTMAGSRRALATRSRPTCPCSQSQSNACGASAIPSCAAAEANAPCRSPATALVAAGFADEGHELVDQRAARADRQPDDVPFARRRAVGDVDGADEPGVELGLHGIAGDER